MPSASHYLRLKHAAKSKAAALGLGKNKLEKNTDDATTVCGDQPPSLGNLFSSFHHSYLLHLQSETNDNLAKSLRKRMELKHDHPGRPVYNGHYVRVTPQPLKNPKLVLVSEDVCTMIGLDPDVVIASDEFVKYFSGDIKGALSNYRDVDVETWATPYALSIMGKQYVQDAYSGDGYGDGRAISVGEVLVPNSSDETTIDPDSYRDAVETSKQYYPDHACRYELQLKGSGATPFCRGGESRIHEHDHMMCCV